MNTTKQEKAIKELFVGKCWEYLNDNFHKFTEANKIKIALTLATKDIPMALEHSGTIDVNVFTEKLNQARSRVPFLSNTSQN
jgi:hypothetical protein